MSNKRLLWLDVLRGIAMLAVLYEHLVYFNPRFLIPSIQFRTNFSVCWFVLVSAIVNSIRFEKSGILLKEVINYYYKKLELFANYAVGTIFLYLIWAPNPKISEIIGTIKDFSIVPPFHFFLVLFQLLFVFPILAICVRMAKRFWLAVLMVLVCIISWYFGTLTILPTFYLPYRLVGGGLYLAVFTMGIIYVRHKPSKPVVERVLACCFLMLLELLRVANPEGFTSIFLTPERIFYALSLFFVMKALVEVSEGVRLWRIFAWLGRNTLWIFILHWWILDTIKKAGINSYWIISGLLALFVVGVGFTGSAVTLIRSRVYGYLRKRL